MCKQLLPILILLFFILINAPYGASESYQIVPNIRDYKTNKDYQYIYEVNRDVNGTGQIAKSENAAGMAEKSAKKGGK